MSSRNSVILVCAATSVEAKACRQGIARAGQADQFEVLQTGMGMIQARHALELRLLASQLPKPSQIISAGFAGSWTNDLAIGSWTLGQSVEIQDGLTCMELLQKDSSKVRLQESLLSRKLSFSIHPSRVITIEKANSHGKTSSPSSLPVIVDMESYAWAEICQARDIPFQILRMVSDNPSAPLPEAIGSFASITTAPTLQQKFQSLTRGLAQAVQEPKVFAGFIARGTQLPGLLSQGWQEIASQ
jgi:nucleoside phosphorylase